MKKLLLSLIFFLCLVGKSNAQQYANTIKYDSIQGSPKATLASIDWISGHWRGESFGGITEEIWSPPLGGSMMCSFKLVVNGKTTFYEFVTIVEEKGSLLLRLKHFHSNLKGWEEKDKSINFPLVKLEKDKVWFDEFTFEKNGPDGMNIYVVLHQKDGTKEETKFTYKRFKSL